MDIELHEIVSCLHDRDAYINYDTEVWEFVECGSYIANTLDGKNNGEEAIL